MIQAMTAIHAYRKCLPQVQARIATVSAGLGPSSNCVAPKPSTLRKLTLQRQVETKHHTSARESKVITILWPVG
jgi:hypothetical protein